MFRVNRGAVLATDLRDALSSGFEAAGWTVELEPAPRANALWCYAGPAVLAVTRATTAAGRQ